MQQFANRMKDLAASNDYRKRIKFAIQDVLELRQNNWQERVLKEQMKTKDQIRKDAVREARAQQSGSQNPYASMQIAGQRPQSAAVLAPAEFASTNFSFGPIVNRYQLVEAKVVFVHSTNRTSSTLEKEHAE